MPPEPIVQQQIGDQMAALLERCKPHLLKHPNHDGEPPTADTINAVLTSWRNRHAT